MKIEISDHLLELYKEHSLNSILPDYDIAKDIEQLIEFDFRRRVIPGYHLNELTGCKTHLQLEVDVYKSLMGHDKNGPTLSHKKYLEIDVYDSSVGNVPGIFSNRYLCIDINKFKNYLDYYGLTEGDKVLQKIAKQLYELYPSCEVYRFGGDEFVVELGDKAFVPFNPIDNIQFKYSILEVNAERIHERRSYVAEAIMLYLHKGMLEATLDGKMLAFNDPD